MAQKNINIGTPNGKDGDFVRDAFSKTEDNFTELYNLQNLNNRIISTGVHHVSGLSFYVVVESYIINGEFLPASPFIAENVQLTAADPTHPRKDIIVVDKDENIFVITGTPAANPIEPILTDYNNQLKITSILVAAGATTPSGVSKEIVYGENLGESTEWTTTESTGGARIDLGSLDDPDTGSAHIETTNALVGDIITFTNDTPLSLENFSSLSLRIKKKAVGVQELLVSLWNSGVKISNATIYIKNNKYGYVDSNITTYQTVVIPSSAMSITGSEVDVIKIEVTGVTSNILIDNIDLNYGVPLTNSSTEPTGLEAINEGNGIGWRLIGRDPADYGNIGLNSVDFSYSSDFGSATGNGVTGSYSLAAGYNNVVSGFASFAVGSTNTLAGNLSYALGINNIAVAGSTTIGKENSAQGQQSIAIGYGSLTKSYSEISIGAFPTDYTALSAVAFQSLDRIFNIGNGTANGSRSDAFTILKNGLITAPSLTTALIDAEATGRALVTKEWVVGEIDKTYIDALNVDADTLDGFDSGDFVKQTEAEITLDQQVGLWDKNTQITVKKDGSGDYTTIQAAITAIEADLVNTDIREILVYDDFEALDDPDYPSYNIGSVDNAIFKMKSNLKVRGVGGAKKIYSTMPTNKANPLYYDYTQAIYFAGGGELENLHIIAKNTRYPIHSDAASCALTKARIVDCIIEHLGCDDVPDSPAGNRWHQPSGWGGGTRSGQIIDFVRTDFLSPIYPFSNHSNIDFTQPTRISFDTCKFINSKHGYSVNIEVYGSGMEEVYEFNNSQFSGAIKYLGNWNSSVSKEDARTLVPIIKGRGNSPVLFNNTLVPSTSSGQVLKITSNSTGASSKVKVTGGTAKDLIFGTEYTKNGGGSLSGFSHGTREVRYGTAGAAATQYSHTLGHRLGDCTGVNKTLIVEVDGVVKTITFNLDYAGGIDTGVAPAIDNTTILASMTASLGTATASTFSLPAEYYPEWTDAVEIRANESTTDEILIGMGCMAVGTSFVRKAVEGEVPDFIALDNILPSAISGVLDDRGRLLKFGYLQVTDRFQPLWDGATPTFVAGDKARIGTTAGKFIKDTTGKTAMVAIDDDATGEVILGFNLKETQTIDKPYVDALGVDALTLENFIPQQHLSYGASYEGNFRERMLNLGATYFPNEIAYHTALHRYLGVTPSILLLPSAQMVGSVLNVLPKDTSLAFDFARAGTANYTDEWGATITAAANEPRIDYSEGFPVILCDTGVSESISNGGDSSSLSGSEVCMVVRVKCDANGGAERRIGVNDGTSANRGYISFSATANTIVLGYYNASVLTGLVSTASTDQSQWNTIAITLKTNAYSLWINGVKVGTDATGTFNNVFTRMDFNNALGGVLFDGKIAFAKYFQSIPTDEQMAILTRNQ